MKKPQIPSSGGLSFFFFRYWAAPTRPGLALPVPEVRKSRTATQPAGSHPEADWGSRPNG